MYIPEWFVEGPRHNDVKRNEDRGHPKEQPALGVKGNPPGDHHQRVDHHRQGGPGNGAADLGGVRKPGEDLPHFPGVEKGDGQFQDVPVVLEDQRDIDLLAQVQKQVPAESVQKNSEQDKNNHAYGQQVERSLQPLGQNFIDQKLEVESPDNPQQGKEHGSQEYLHQKSLVRGDQAEKSRKKPGGLVASFESFFRDHQDQDPGPDLLKPFPAVPYDPLRRVGDQEPFFGYLVDDHIMQEVVLYHVGDGRQRQPCGQVLGPGLHPLGGKTELIGGLDHPESIGPLPVRPGDLPDPGNRQLQPVLLGHNRQAGRAAVGYVMLLDTIVAFKETSQHVTHPVIPKFIII